MRGQSGAHKPAQSAPYGMRRITAMKGKRSTAKYLALAGLMLTALASCERLQTGAAGARIDAMRPHIGPCAGALAADDMPAARAACTPLVVIADGAG